MRNGGEGVRKEAGFPAALSCPTAWDRRQDRRCEQYAYSARKGDRNVRTREIIADIEQRAISLLCPMIVRIRNRRATA